jgi:DHA1 family arabinose polymer transporter-like MFS transporter
LASPAPWLIFAATMFGNAGVFAWFSYIKPFMLNVPALPKADDADYDAGGAGDGGRQSVQRQNFRALQPAAHRGHDRRGDCRDAAADLSFGEHKRFADCWRFSAVPDFALSAPLQILLLQNAKGGEMLGAAGGQIAFNLGSAIGAFCGGMMIARALAGTAWRSRPRCRFWR